jgi:hypothetical protein
MAGNPMSRLGRDRGFVLRCFVRGYAHPLWHSRLPKVLSTRSINEVGDDMVVTRDLRGAARLDIDLDRWTQIAQTVRQLAARSGQRIDDETLIHYDIRELLGLEQRLRAERKRVAYSRLGLHDDNWIAYPARRESSFHEYASSLNSVLAVFLAMLLPLAAPVVAILILAAIAR